MVWKSSHGKSIPICMIMLTKWPHWASNIAAIERLFDSGRMLIRISTTARRIRQPSYGGVVSKGRVVLFAQSPGPPVGNLMESRLASAGRADFTRPDSLQVRYIGDPRNEVNERLKAERHPKSIIPRHQNVARMITYWRRRYPAIPILICNRNVKGAFELIPASVKGLAYTGCRSSIYMVL